MNEQPFADPANPPTPNLRSRNNLTKRVNELQQEIARCIAENNAKGAVVALQQLNSILHMLLIDELQSTQQMFERLDKRIDGLAHSAPQPVIHQAALGEVPQVSLQAAEHDAIDKTVETLEALVREDPDGLLALGTQLMLDTLTEYRMQFIKPRGQ